MRDSPSLAILPVLADKDVSIRAHDPEGSDEAQKVLSNSMLYVDSIYEAIHEADAVVLITEWNSTEDLIWKKSKTR